ncbi:MAG: TraI domain-containing protein, partial [Gammaproteobacteria bacterium]|nr:TraI domain-containing protein [Gammaproteobacteria bacterium]
MAQDEAEQAMIFRRPTAAPTAKAADALPVRTATELLAPRHAAVREIAQLCAVPQTHFSELYAAAIHAFAQLVQQLPASESHHHCGPGG